MAERHTPLRGSAIILAVVLLVGTASFTAHADRTLTVIQSIDSENIISTVEDLEDFGSRDFHLNSSLEAAEYIYSRFEDIGIQVEYQEFAVGTVLVRNVVATLEGDSADEQLFLFGAHYDSENTDVFSLSDAEQLLAPGADDDASGIAVIIEIARVLSSIDSDRTVKFVAFGAEEYGFDNLGGSAGSQYFVSSELQAGVEYRATAILDMVGYRSTSENRAVFVTDSGPDEFVQACSHAVEEFDIDLDLTVLNDHSITYSDHEPFWSAGYPSVLVTEDICPITLMPVNPNYHSAADTSDTLSQEQMEAVAEALLGGFLSVTDTGRESSWTVAVVIGAASICAAALVVFIVFKGFKGRDLE